MEPSGMLVFLSLLLVIVQTAPTPGGSHHHIHHRIHVPQKIKTIFHTKIVKVPEHHHYYHEKEKVIPVHVEKEKYIPVPVHHKEEPIYPPLSEDFDGYAGHGHSYDGGDHNILKKHAPNHQPERRKQRRVRKS